MSAAFPPVFVLNPAHAAARGPSVRSQLKAFSLKYTPVRVPGPDKQTPQALVQKYGEHIFRFDCNPYSRMPAASVARTLEYCRIFAKMEKQNCDAACILREGGTLNEHFPALLQTSEALHGDWDILILGCAGPPPHPLWFRHKPRLCKEFRLVQSARMPCNIAGFLIRRQAARNIRALALPVRKPVEQYLLNASQYGMRLRFVLPAILSGEKPAPEQPAEDAQAVWKDWMASVYSAEYLKLLDSEALQTQSDAVPPQWALLQKLCDRLPGAQWLQHTGGALLTRLGLTPADLRRLPAAQSVIPLQPPDRDDAADARVAAVIPLFNREHLILPVIKSLEQQTRPPQRLIVVDDGSSDNSTRVVEQYFASARLPFTAELLRHGQNRGASAARNSGLQRADDCEFVYFLDSDDCPPKDFLQRAVARLAREPEAVAASANRMLAQGRDGVAFQSLRELEDSPRLWFLLHGAGIASGTLFRRSVFERAGVFNPNLPTGQDTDLFHRIAGFGKWRHLPGAPVMICRMPEHNNLYKSYASDYNRRWMYIWENNLYRQSDAQYIETLALRRRLREGWRLSGIFLCREKRFAEANECFRRALAHGFSLKLLWCLKIPGFPSTLLLRDLLLYQTGRLLQQLASTEADAFAHPGAGAASLPVFVLNPARSSARRPSVRSQLKAFSLKYTPVREPGPTGRTPQALAQKYGKHIFRFDHNPYWSMPAASVARTLEYCRIFQRMEEQNCDAACILREGATLNEHFPALLQAPEVLHGDWDILILGCAGPPPSPLWLRHKPRLCKEFRLVRPTRTPCNIAGFLIRRQAARNIQALALPIREPVEQHLLNASRYGMRLRFVQPAILRGEQPAPEQPAGEAPAWKYWVASMYSAEYLKLLDSDALQTQSDTAPPRWALLQKLYGRLPGAQWLQRTGSALLTRLGLSPGDLRRLPAAQSAILLKPTDRDDVADARVAAIIPLFNREHLILPVIKSLEQQTRPPQHLIVVDDGSSDNGAHVVEQYFASARLPFTAELLRHGQNRGASAARNSGLQRADDCEFVYFLDSDDCPPEDFLQRAVARLMREPEAVAASVDRMFLYDGRRRWLHSLRELADNPRRWFLLHGAGIASGTLFRRSVFERTGVFDLGLPTGEDTDLFHRIAGYGKWLHLPGAPMLMMSVLKNDNLSKNYAEDRWYNWVRTEGNELPVKNYAADGWRRWSYVWENILYRQPGMSHVSVSERRDRLCTAWENSGISLYRGGRFAEANECFRRALVCRFSVRLLWYLKIPGLPSVMLFREHLLHSFKDSRQRVHPAVAEVSGKLPTA